MEGFAEGPATWADDEEDALVGSPLALREAISGNPGGWGVADGVLGYVAGEEFLDRVEGVGVQALF